MLLCSDKPMVDYKFKEGRKSRAVPRNINSEFLRPTLSLIVQFSCFLQCGPMLTLIELTYSENKKPGGISTHTQG